MTVAASQEITAGKGAELIRTTTGRSCTRQNLEKLCKQGKLPRSCVSQAPVRVLPRAAAAVVDLAVVDVVHACFQEPTPFV
jgi:hypothetical protein